MGAGSRPFFLRPRVFFSPPPILRGGEFCFPPPTRAFPHFPVCYNPPTIVSPLRGGFPDKNLFFFSPYPGFFGGPLNFPFFPPLFPGGGFFFPPLIFLGPRFLRLWNFGGSPLSPQGKPLLCAPPGPKLGFSPFFKNPLPPKGLSAQRY